MVIKIGIWGGPSSGKTTYLAALRLAAMKHPGLWTVNGRDDICAGSTNFLSDATNTLLRGGFLAADPAGLARAFAYQVSGNVTSRTFFGSFSQPVSFTIYVEDFGGGDFAKPDPRHPVWKYLADCDGLIFLFDHKLETSEKPTFDYMQNTVDYVKSILRSQNKLLGSTEMLPHYLVFCLSKYDEPATFRWLKENGLIVQSQKDPKSIPYVSNARQAAHLSNSLAGQWIERNFSRERIGYLATSSIGFYIGSSGKIDINDCANVVTTPSGQKIRSGKNTNPINVIEPLLWIERKISGR